MRSLLFTFSFQDKSIMPFCQKAPSPYGMVRWSPRPWPPYWFLTRYCNDATTSMHTLDVKSLAVSRSGSGNLLKFSVTCFLSLLKCVIHCSVGHRVSCAIVTDLSSLAFPNCLWMTLNFPEMAMFPQKSNERSQKYSFVHLDFTCFIWLVTYITWNVFCQSVICPNH